MSTTFLDNDQTGTVATFSELVQTEFKGKQNALCWYRNLEGDFKEIGTRITLIKRIFTDFYLINNKLLIDIGLNKQLKTGLAVINKDGLVGQISIVNRNNAQVILTTNPEFKIYVQTQTSKVKMLATGIGNNRIMVKYIKKSDQLHEGDILVTTGLDDIYPANIPVAKIIKIFYENNGFNSALCEPIVNFNILKYILVMKNANQ